MLVGMKVSTESTTEAVWRERVRAWRASGKTAEQFTWRRDYAASTLRRWSSKLGWMEAPAFVRVVPRTPEVTEVSEIVIEIGAARVRVTPGFDATLLADVVRTLGGVQ